MIHNLTDHTDVKPAGHHFAWLVTHATDITSVVTFPTRSGGGAFVTAYLNDEGTEYLAELEVGCTDGMYAVLEQLAVAGGKQHEVRCLLLTPRERKP